MFACECDFASTPCDSEWNSFIRRGSSPMGAPVSSRIGGQVLCCDSQRESDFNRHFSLYLFDMNYQEDPRTGIYWRCPWCGRRSSPEKRVLGYGYDLIGYPICVSDPSPCAEKMSAGISRNGVRAGALYQILKRDERFDAIYRAQPDFYLKVSDFMYGTALDRPKRFILLYEWNALKAWQQYYDTNIITETSEILRLFRAAVNPGLPLGGHTHRHTSPYSNSTS